MLLTHSVKRQFREVFTVLGKTTFAVFCTTAVFIAMGFGEQSFLFVEPSRFTLMIVEVLVRIIFVSVQSST